MGLSKPFAVVLKHGGGFIGLSARSDHHHAAYVMASGVMKTLVGLARTKLVRVLLPTREDLRRI
jgi:hypothetical protein